MEKSFLSLTAPTILALVLTLALANTAAAQPNLVLDNITVYDIPSHGIYSPGDSVNVGGTVRNAGDLSVGDYTLDFYAGDYHIGSLSDSGLGAGQNGAFGTTCSLPDDIPYGDYIVWGKVSWFYGGSQYEDESSASSIIVGIYEPPPPVPQDLRLWHVAITNRPNDNIFYPGDSVDVECRVENIGEEPSDSYTVDFYADGDSIGSESLSGLDPGDTDSISATWSLPDDISEGSYSVTAELSTSNDSDSGNNSSYANITVAYRVPPDVSIQSVDAAAGTYSPGDQIKVYSLIKNIGERTSESYTVDYYLSTDTTITTADYKIGYVNRSALAPGEQHSYETTCQFPINIPAGDCYIGVIVTCPKDYDPANNVSWDAATVELVHPAGYVCGRMNYADRWGRKHPIRYALVEMYADDNNNDRLIGQTHTDRNGDYGVVLSNDENQGRDIYVRVLCHAVACVYPGTTSKICTLIDDVLNETYSLASPLYSRPRDSSVVINMTAPNSGGEFMVYDSIIEGFHKAKTFFGIELEGVTTYWPSEADASYFDPREAGIYISQDDRGDRDVIMHEYAHYIADTYGVGQGPVGENSGHYWDRDLREEPEWRTAEHAMNLAFREAWASLFSIATQYGDTGYPYSGDSQYDDLDEQGDWSLTVDLANDFEEGQFSPGQYYENMNAGALWDIFDDKIGGFGSKDTLSDPSLTMIWTISRDYKPESIVDFWNSWFRSYDHEQEMKYIFNAHGMPFVKPGQ